MMSMSPERSSTLKFPSVLHGPRDAVLSQARAEGRRCVRHYLKHGVFPEPTLLREVPPGEEVLCHSAVDLQPDRPAWRLYLFLQVMGAVWERVTGEELEKRHEAFEVFCRETPWGALFCAVQPSGPWSVKRMAPRLEAVLRHWEALRGPTYIFREPRLKYTLEELMEDIYRPTLEAWHPGARSSVRAQLEETVRRMGRAGPEDCLEAVLRVMSHLVSEGGGLKHREILGDKGWLREHLAALSPERFERISSAEASAVNEQLREWDRALGRHSPSAR